MTQKELAETTGMGQPRIPLLEDSTYENWTVNTLKRLAKAFDVALSVRFETFSTVMRDFANMSRESLQRPGFANDPVFHSRRVPTRHKRRVRRHSRRRGTVVQFSRISSIGYGDAQIASLELGTNQIAAKKKEPRREELAN